MNRTELMQTKESYRSLAKECLKSESPYPMITGICKNIAKEMCYNHHERGQHLWAFFQALEEESGETHDERTALRDGV